VRHPGGRADERRTVARDRVRQSDTVGGAAEGDVLARGGRILIRDRRGFVYGTDELVAAAADRTDIALGATVIAEGATSCFDAAGQRRLADEVPTPHRCEQLIFGDQPIPVAHQLAEHFEHLRLDVDDPVFVTEFEALGVEHEPVEVPDTCAAVGIVEPRSHWR
jgi:hypothetical protein